MGKVRTREPVAIAKADDVTDIYEAGFDDAMKLMVKLAALGGWDREEAIDVMNEALDDISTDIHVARDAAWQKMKERL